jgi:hypothetical protein
VVGTVVVLVVGVVEVDVVVAGEVRVHRNPEQPTLGLSGTDPAADVERQGLSLPFFVHVQPSRLAGHQHAVVRGEGQRERAGNTGNARVFEIGWQRHSGSRKKEAHKEPYQQGQGYRGQRTCGHTGLLVRSYF